MRRLAQEGSQPRCLFRGAANVTNLVHERGLLSREPPPKVNGLLTDLAVLAESGIADGQ